MKVWTKIILAVVFSLVCSSVFASEKVSDLPCGEGFLCHKIVKEDQGWTYFALSYGIPVDYLRSWNKELSEVSINHFPINAVIRYKTREMMTQEENAKTEEMLQTVTAKVNSLEKATEELAAQQTVAIEAVQSTPEVVKTKKNISVLFYFLVIIAIFVLCLVVKRLRRGKAIKSLVHSKQVLKFNVQALGLTFFYQPVMVGEGNSKFSCPFTNSHKELKFVSYSNPDDVTRSLVSSFKKSSELIDLITNGDGKYGILTKEVLNGVKK